MSDLQDIIATSSIKAFNHGMKAERQHIIQLIEKHKQETSCDCSGCESWTNAFEFLKREIKGEING
jgi:hypothetical protein